MTLIEMRRQIDALEDELRRLRRDMPIVSPAEPIGGSGGAAPSPVRFCIVVGPADDLSDYKAKVRPVKLSASVLAADGDPEDVWVWPNTRYGSTYAAMVRGAAPDSVSQVCRLEKIGGLKYVSPVWRFKLQAEPAPVAKRVC